MKTVHQAVLLLALTAPFAAHAHEGHEHGKPAQAAELPMVAAEVLKVDAGAGKMTLRHQDIPNLNMPAMSMVFQVKDKAVLAQFKAGDKVSFAADKVNGANTIMKIEASKAAETK